ncbi:hypothetical protein CHS0354_014845 [Potamilus streckersoni]|uniref:Uncharacterized protein n=1 Tax=Potamilus streckersoni TaxID=2493646 RepID=A0AAE0VKN0_9BIVA|nr:hypothetical protein CHS0354_014845 [Potamilus streckersoni]
MKYIHPLPGPPEPSTSCEIPKTFFPPGQETPTYQLMNSSTIYPWITELEDYPTGPKGKQPRKGGIKAKSSAKQLASKQRHVTIWSDHIPTITHTWTSRTEVSQHRQPHWVNYTKYRRTQNNPTKQKYLHSQRQLRKDKGYLDNGKGTAEVSTPIMQNLPLPSQTQIKHRT